MSPFPGGISCNDEVKSDNCTSQNVREGSVDPKLVREKAGGAPFPYIVIAYLSAHLFT